MFHISFTHKHLTLNLIPRSTHGDSCSNFSSTLKSQFTENKGLLENLTQTIHTMLKDQRASDTRQSILKTKKRKLKTRYVQRESLQCCKTCNNSVARLATIN